MAADPSATLTAGIKEPDDTVVRRAVYLFVVAEGARPAAGGARYRIDDVDAVHLGRGDGDEREVARKAGVGGTTVLELRIPDRRLSSKHARLQRGGRGWVVIDSGSKNGTVVDGVLADRVSLHDGALIEVGQTVLVFRDSLNVDGRGAVAELAGAGHIIDSLLPETHDTIGRMVTAAASDLPVLLQGETGTGKEVMARHVHAVSGRTGDLVAVNCGALAAGLVESALFGHRKGAFTGAERDHEGYVQRANGGTLFLDEIGDLPLAAQVALLRVLNEHEVVPVGATSPIPVDFRLVTATHRDLDAMVEAGTFRLDLMGRIAGFRFTLPPLRQRREDMGALIGALLAAGAGDGAAPRVSLAALRAIAMYDWPSNVRELDASLSVARVLAGDAGEIDVGHLPETVVRGATVPSPSEKDRALRRKLVALLEKHKGNVSAVARATGKARMQIQRWLKRYKLDPADYRD